MERPTFAAFFEAVTGHSPYLWQVRAAERIRDGDPPNSIFVPTGMGKTFLMVAWLWALINEACLRLDSDTDIRRIPLRYVLVVDRRVVVDDTAGAAQRIARVLTSDQNPTILAARDILHRAFGDDEDPLAVTVLRGGMSETAENLTHPAKPGIVIGTVDMIGSRLLFRGYGVAPTRRPIEAALIGVDTMFVLDEAHLSPQLLSTLELLHDQQQVESRWWGSVPARTLTVMTATPQSEGHQCDIDAEASHSPTFGKRHQRRRDTELQTIRSQATEPGKAVAEQIKSMKCRSGEFVLVFSNTPADAVSAAQAARKNKSLTAESAEIITLIGGMPDLARRDALRDHTERIRTGGTRTDDVPPLIICATQTLEVGADIDADTLITPLCSASALRQRLGRVNRVGDRRGCTATIVVHSSEKPLPVYGEAAVRLGKHLLSSPPSNLGALNDQLNNSNAKSEWENAPSEPATMPHYAFHAYQRTEGSPYEPPVGRWLRAPRDPTAEVSVAFREAVDLIDDDEALIDHITECWPRSDEIWTLPLFSASELTKESPRCVVLDSARQADPVVTDSPDELRPGHLLVLSPSGPQDNHLLRGVTRFAEDLPRLSDPRPFILIEEDLLATSADRETANSLLGTSFTEHRPLLDRAGESIGWVEVRPISSEVEARHTPTSPYPLDDHHRDVEEIVTAWSRRLGVPDDLIADLAMAARHHDLGKLAPHTQRELAYQVNEDGELEVIEPVVPIGKSALPRRLWRKARQISGVPAGFRHEAESAERVDELLMNGELVAKDPELVRHLILTHHGRFRGLGMTMTEEGPAYQDPQDPRWARRPVEFQQLLRRYGPYTLAWAETVLRLADWEASKEVTR